MGAKTMEVEEGGEWRTKVHVTDHPLVRTKLSIIRDRKTDSKVFRELVYEIGLYVGFQATSRLATNVEKNVGKRSAIFEPGH